MTWRGRTQGGRRSERAATPADTEATAADIKAARRALEQVERATEKSRSRWPLINRTVAILREIRETNHLAEDLDVIFSHHRSSQ